MSRSAVLGVVLGLVVSLGVIFAHDFWLEKEPVPIPCVFCSEMGRATDLSFHVGAWNNNTKEHMVYRCPAGHIFTEPGEAIPVEIRGWND